MFQSLGNIERASLNIATQWKPNSNLSIFLEGFETQKFQFAPTMVDVLLQYICPDPAKDTVYPGTNIVSHSVSSCYDLTSIQDRHSSENTMQIASGFDYAASDNWEVTGEVDVTLSSAKTFGYVVDDTYNIPTDGLADHQQL